LGSMSMDHHCIDHEPSLKYSGKKSICQEKKMKNEKLGNLL